MKNRQVNQESRISSRDSESARQGTPADQTGNKEPNFSVQVPQISLPKGGGAIKGIDEKFEVNAANGTASLSLPLPFSPGRNGFMPSISLGYNSGAGNGLFGLGWDLGYPSIQRKTDKKLPRYRDDEDSDTFMFSGVEDLVPILNQDGGPSPEHIRWIPDVREEEGFIIHGFRPRLEGAFSRIERITHKDYEVWWKVTTRENVVTFFGKSPQYRIADPINPARIFQWLPELSFDEKGNCVLYEFRAEDGVGYGSDLFDVNRFDADGSPRFTNRYLKHVYYCPRTPFQPYRTFQEQNLPIPASAIYRTENPVAENGFLMELVLDYGEHGDLPDKEQGTVAVQYNLGSEALAWPTRHDAFSTYRSGFEIRVARLCRRVLMFHHFAELGEAPCLVRSLDLKYRNWSLQQEPEEGKIMEVTYLTAAVQRSYIREANNPIHYRYRGLPAIEFGYEELDWDKKVQTISPENTVNAPVGLTSDYQWVDLYNEGISGILTEQGEGWFYKENLGNGQFTSAKPIIPKPSFMGIASGVLQLQDLEADGRKQVVVNSPGLNGYFELAEDQSWETFRAFGQIPNVDLRDPNTRLLDLNGDGQPDIVITEESAFTWYPAAGVKGYDAPELAPKPFDEEQGPAIVFADSTQSIFLADMSGDGLTDIARIRNGEVCYWPNLGYGRFGAKITMSRSPWFDTDGQFNPTYLQLADVSGTGATDILYLGKKQFRAWLNLSGNAWSSPCDIDPFLDATQPNQVSVTDFLGNGTSCIVWSSPLPEHAGAPLRYIDLMGGKKPHILRTYTNNLGKTTTWTYRSSTHFYLEDKKAGKPWITKLPFPVQVVSSVTMEDAWRNTRFANAYSYHHGYYDHPEREFRGFGRVEQTDVEDFGTFVTGNANSPYITADETLYQPPVKTITWYHTGAFLSRERILNQFADEYFRPNGGDFYENELPEPDLERLGLSADEYREALRACKGMALRTEVYELDVDALSRGEHLPVKLFSAAFHNCHIRRLQARAGNRYAVFLATESEAITYHYELPMMDGRPAAPADPRIAHTFNLRQDELGNPLETLAVAYPRWRDAEFNDSLLPDGAEALIQSVQREMHLVYTENQLTNDIRTPQDYRLRVPCEVRTYELTGLRPANGRYFSLAELRAAQPASWVEIPYQQLPDREAMQKRLVERVRMLYFAENLKDALPFGQLNRLGLPYETYKIALTEDLLNGVLGDKLPTLQRPGQTRSEMLERILTEGGYHQFNQEPGLWWIRSGIAGFQDDAAAHFYLPERYTDPFGAVTTLTFDTYDLFMERSEDPLGNRVEVLHFDYRVLAPLEMRDPNDNLSEVAYDLLGVPAAVASKGKGDEGDNLDGVVLNLDETAIRTFFTGDYDEAQARLWLGNATARHIYYLGDAEHPSCAAGILREKHVALLEANEISPIQIAFEYSDGGGAVIATKAMAEPETSGGPLRWITNGRTVLNNKGKPVKQYEPYFTEHHRYAEPEAVGVTPIIYYDAAGRTVRTEMPDGTFSRVEFSPWLMCSFDANDTIEELGHSWSERYSGTEHQRAIGEAMVHSKTPNETHLDSLGREVIAIAHNCWTMGGVLQPEKYLTYTKLDAEGKPLWLQDARGNYVMVYARVFDPDNFQDMVHANSYVPAYDLAGNLLFQYSNEAGERWMLPDTTGQALYTWDVRGNLLHTRYDALRRPFAIQLYNAEHPAGITVAYTQYGDENGATLPLAERQARQADNLLGQVYRSFDQSGMLLNQRFDFKGLPLANQRRLLRGTVQDVDWSGALDLPFSGLPESLQGEENFVKSTRYDALGRMIELKNWQLEGRSPAVYTPSYNLRGNLLSEKLQVGGVEKTAIQHIVYNAKGQRTRLHLGNDTTTHYSYDDHSFRLQQLRTIGKNGEVLQDLSYTYDPVGNICSIVDAAQDTLYFRNRRVEPRCRYTYDALYRLIAAEGREHLGPNAGTATPQPGDPWAGFHGHHAHPGDGNAMGTYLQRYIYDAAGNILALHHQNRADIRLGYTRYYQYETRSNRLLATQINGNAPASPYADVPTLEERYDYNAHGSMTRMPHLPVMDWDFTEHLAHIGIASHPGASPSLEAWYRYDAQKQRSYKRVLKQGGTWEERLYLEGYELYRRYGAGNTLVEEIETNHLFADEQRVLIVEEVRETDNLDLRTGLLYRYQYSNHLGSASLEMDDSDTPRIISYEEYHPYGTTAYHAQNADIKAAAKRYRYTGMERDEESGLAYHTARYYLAWLGRWGSCDPIGVEGGGNLFCYCNNQPLYLLDIVGKQPFAHTSSSVRRGRTTTPVQLGEQTSGGESIPQPPAPALPSTDQPPQNNTQEGRQSQQGSQTSDTAVQPDHSMPLRGSGNTGYIIELLVGGPYRGHAYGHTAIRVTTPTGDFIYDYGRYGRTWGTFNSQGEGILRVWDNFQAYIRGENATGRTTTSYSFNVDQGEAESVIEFFRQQTNGRTPRPAREGDHHRTYRLARDYDALEFNCTVISIDAFREAIPGFDRRSSSFIEGRGLPLPELTAARIQGFPQHLFMPLDLQAYLRSRPFRDQLRLLRRAAPSVQTHSRPASQSS